MVIPSRQEVHAWATSVEEPPSHVVAVGNVPALVAETDIRDSLRKLLGPDKVWRRGRVYDSTCNRSAILFTVGRDICQEMAANTLVAPECPPEGYPFIYSELPVIREMFSSRGPTQVPEEPSASTWPLPTPVSKAITMAAQSQSYRKLKAFSGVLPTPQGEEGIDLWRENALKVVEEWSCTDTVKRQRIMECLRPPASTIVTIHRDQHPELTALEMVEFLFEAYELAEDEGAIWTKYFNVYQKEGEDVSAFIHRLQLVLGILLNCKLIPASGMDEALHKQYLRGSSPTHPIANMLRSKIMDGGPSMFTELLRQVKMQ
ncbi:paraneoplastic antigen Ma2 homolog [Ascaphus truei]|uniref:paraneoplastic antigen Ma2 homolog n=1 Tax=Ascaphus truei TaxID=8439 RepID=UPI003F593743